MATGSRYDMLSIEKASATVPGTITFSSSLNQVRHLLHETFNGFLQTPSKERRRVVTKTIRDAYDLTRDSSTTVI